MAIETGHLLGLAFGRPWQQTEGLLHSLTALLGADVGVPVNGRRSAEAIANQRRRGEARWQIATLHGLILATGGKAAEASRPSCRSRQRAIWLVCAGGSRRSRKRKEPHDLGSEVMGLCLPPAGES